MQGIVFIPKESSWSCNINYYSVNVGWCTELPIRPKRIVKKVKVKPEPKLSLDDLAGSDTLCEHCHCTEYGLHMGASEVRGTPTGYSSCEGAYCGDAYAHYLDN